MSTVLGLLSQWRDPASIDAAKARVLVERLELRARTEDEVATRTAYLDLLAPRLGERALDVGCGSGAVTRDLARRVVPGGCAVGLDGSREFLALARERAQTDGLGDVIEFREGDARALPFPDASFDVVVAATVLAHIPGGERAIPEMVRVTRPGGRVGIFDLDGDGIVLTHPDRELTRRIVAAASDHSVVDGWLARRLPGLLERAGLADVGVRGFTPLDRAPTSFYGSYAERAAEIAAKTGAISTEEHRQWLEDLHAERAAGTFLSGRLHIFAWGRRSR